MIGRGCCDIQRGKSPSREALVNRRGAHARGWAHIDHRDPA